MFLNLPSLLVTLASLTTLAQALCPDKCTCDDVNLIVTCIRAGLEVMPNTLNPRLQTIIYKYNSFPMVDVSLRFLSELVKVDLSHNHIVSVTNHAFASQTSLKSLRLDSNKISEISNKTFFGLSRAEILSMRNNEVGSLPGNLFMHSPKLQKIDLARNRISEVNERAFAGLENLEILHLEDNYLSSIPTEAFRLIPNLAELYLSGNSFSVVPANAFMPFRALTVLELASCQIANIDEMGFRGLGTLRKLKLNDNNMTEVPAMAFRNIAGLRGLDIGRNHFDTILPNAFRYLSKLRHIDISGCSKLTDISSNAFSGCVDLEHVTISLNRKLSQLSAEAFDALPALRYFNIADNNLHHVAEKLVPWRHLHSLDLSGNPWQCDCDLSFIPQVLQSLRERVDQRSNSTSADGQGQVEHQVIAGNCAGPQTQHSVSLHDFVPDCQTGSGANLGTATTLADFRESATNGESSDSSVYPKGVDVMRDNNTTAVIISVSIVVIVLALAISLFICVKCRTRYRDWAKRYRLWRHSAEASPATSSTVSGATKSGSTLRRPPQYSDHFYYPSPYRQASTSQGHYSPYSPYYTQHHQQLVRHAAPSTSDDEYYYVSTSLRGGTDTSAKHIPVTVL